MTLKDRCKSKELIKRLEIEDVADVDRKSRLGWFGHLERKDAGDWVSAGRNMVIAGNAEKDRPKKRSNEVVKDDLKKCDLDRGLAKDKDRWKAQIMGKTSHLCEQSSTDKGLKREEIVLI